MKDVITEIYNTHYNELNEWERNFLKSISERTKKGIPLSPKQKAVFDRISGHLGKHDNSITLKPGVYELEGQIYIVKSNKTKTRLYAKKLVEASSERLTESGALVKFDFVYAKGVVFKIKPENQMDITKAKALMIRYGRCIVCGRRLKKAESVERGIGPVCIKYFKGEVA